MIQKSTLQFLKELKKNNTKEWFDINRKEYEAAKKDFLNFIENLIPKVAAFDPEIAEVKSKDTIFRINRDVRFGKDKTPYRAHFGAVLCLKGRKSTYPSYYIHLEPSGVWVGGGAYMLMPNELQKIRQEIDYNSSEFLKIVENKKFTQIFGTVRGEALVKPPKGFEATSEAINYIKHKQWYVMTATFSDAEVQSEMFEKKVIDSFKILQPLNVFLQRAMID